MAFVEAEQRADLLSAIEVLRRVLTHLEAGELVPPAYKRRPFLVAWMQRLESWQTGVMPDLDAVVAEAQGVLQRVLELTAEA